MTSPFDNLTGPGKPLRAEPPDSKEFAGLQRMGLARLKDAQRSGLALDSQFDLAYNAAHALYPSRKHLAPAVRALLDFLIDRFEPVPWALPKPPRTH